MKKYIIFLLSLLISQISFSQQIKKLIQKADSLDNMGKYNEAATIYLKTANVGWSCLDGHMKCVIL